MTAAGHAFGPVADYLPHRPPMLLIDHIVEVTDERAVCRATIQPDCVFAIDGAVHASAMIEWIAQACAIYVGVVSARGAGAARTGILVACREVVLAVDRLAVGDELTIVANKVFVQPQLAAFTGTVERAGERCATVHLSVADAAAAPGASG